MYCKYWMHFDTTKYVKTSFNSSVTTKNRKPIVYFLCSSVLEQTLHAQVFTKNQIAYKNE